LWTSSKFKRVGSVPRRLRSSARNAAGAGKAPRSWLSTETSEADLLDTRGSTFLRHKDHVRRFRKHDRPCPGLAHALIHRPRDATKGLAYVVRVFPVRGNIVVQEDKSSGL